LPWRSPRRGLRACRRSRSAARITSVVWPTTRRWGPSRG
jgi:hypothetical protein